MAGTAIEVGWIQLEKNNVASSEDDDAIYRTDWVLTCDGNVIGYLDTEEKQGWTDHWPYKVINIAKHPMAHWKSGHFSGRLTNKLLSFLERPADSWWVAVRKDWQQAVLVNAEDLFDLGRDAEIRTRYSEVRLPVLQFPNDQARLARNADEFTKVIINRIRSRYAVC
jgi:hypothetical protein